MVWTMVVTDLLIGLAYVSLSLSLYQFAKKLRFRFSSVVLCFGFFIGACGLTHFMEIVTLWYPIYWSAAAVKVVTAITSVATAALLVRLRPQIYDLFLYSRA
jgi:putative effector of murein hydrolase